MSVADILARMIRERVPDWTEDCPDTGLWTWAGTGDWSDSEVILEGRVRRFQPVSYRQHGRNLGPSVDGYAHGIALRIDLPEMVDGSDLRGVLDALERLGILPANPGQETPDV